MKTISGILAILVVSFIFSACSPKVGSDEWCEEMKAKPKGEWTANELGDFTRHCVFR